MRLTSLNLYGYNDWKDREKNIIEFMDDTCADIVCLQEVMYDQDESPYSQAKHINGKLGRTYPYASSAVSRTYEHNGKIRREGLAVLSKYPIIDTESLALHKRPDDFHTRIIQKVSMIAARHVVNIANVHFSNNSYAAEQLDETLNIINTRKGNDIIVGDFNVEDSMLVSRVAAPHYESSADFADYVSYPSTNQTIDYVLTPRDFQFVSLAVREGLSDHNALTVDLQR